MWTLVSFSFFFSLDFKKNDAWHSTSCSLIQSSRHPSSFQTRLGREYMYAYRSSTSRCAFVSRMYVCMQPRAQQEVDTRCVGCVLLLLLLFSVEPRAERLLLLLYVLLYILPNLLSVCVFLLLFLARPEQQQHKSAARTAAASSRVVLPFTSLPRACPARIHLSSSRTEREGERAQQLVLMIRPALMALLVLLPLLLKCFNFFVRSNKCGEALKTVANIPWGYLWYLSVRICKDCYIGTL